MTGKPAAPPRFVLPLVFIVLGPPVVGALVLATVRPQDASWSFAGGLVALLVLLAVAARRAGPRATGILWKNSRLDPDSATYSLPKSGSVSGIRASEIPSRHRRKTGGSSCSGSCATVLRKWQVTCGDGPNRNSRGQRTSRVTSAHGLARYS